MLFQNRHQVVAHIQALGGAPVEFLEGGESFLVLAIFQSLPGDRLQELNMNGEGFIGTCDTQDSTGQPFGISTRTYVKILGKERAVVDPGAVCDTKGEEVLFYQPIVGQRD